MDWQNRARRGRTARDIMDTPKKALNVSRLAVWASFAIAAVTSVRIGKLVALGGLATILTAERAMIQIAVIVVAIIVGGLAYFRPAVWSISLVLVLIALQSAFDLLVHRPVVDLIFDAAWAFLTWTAFSGVRRYEELRAEKNLKALFE